MPNSKRGIKGMSKEGMLSISIAFVIILFFILMFTEPRGIHFTWVDISIASFLLMLFYVLDSVFNLEFKPVHYFFMTLAATVNLIYGPYSFIYFYGDKINHFLQPFCYTVIFTHMAGRLRIKNKWKLVFAFFIVMGILGMFEVAEFGLDKFYDAKLQGVYLVNLQHHGQIYLALDPITDTDLDLLTGMLAAFSAVLFITVIKSTHRKPPHRMKQVLNGYE